MDFSSGEGLDLGLLGSKLFCVSLKLLSLEFGPGCERKKLPVSLKNSQSLDQTSSGSWLFALSKYCNDPKFLERQVWANSVDLVQHPI